jgi:hypothetical protein
MSAEDQVHRLVDETLERNGRIDLLDDGQPLAEVRRPPEAEQP